jgi:glycosyltransferase involved in cell wall biosynthesis
MKNKPVWLSVIIPVFNDGILAIEAVNAILENSPGSLVAGIEILCVEGGSTDDSRELIQDFAITRNQVRLIKAPVKAVSPKFNLGAKKAKGQWLAFTESDCIPQKGWLSSIKKTIDDNRLHACSGRVRAHSDDPNLQLSIRDYKDRKVNRPTFWNKVVPFYHGQGNNFFIERELFLRMGGVNELLGAGAPGRSGQDAELNFRLFSQNIPIGYEPDALVIHYPRETRETFLNKKKNYSFSSTWYRVVLHPSRPESWCEIMLRFLYPLAQIVLSSIALRFNKSEQHWHEWMGFWEGFLSGIKYAVNLTYREDMSKT